MKKLFIFVLFFGLFLQNSTAQTYTPFPDSNAVWSELGFSNYYPDSSQYHTKFCGLIVSLRQSTSF